jgi:hypothetical protein
MIKKSKEYVKIKESEAIKAKLALPIIIMFSFMNRTS